MALSFRERAIRASALLVPTLAIPAACGGIREHPPSVILISIDALRADHSGFHGYERDTTPHLDRLAQESIVFEKAFCPAAWTLISHMTMLTGLYPDQHGIVVPDLALSPDLPFLAEELERAGYQTAALYSSGWIHERHGFGRGFDVFRAHENAEEAGEHLEQVLGGFDPDRPFFLFLHLFDVHSGGRFVYDAPEPYDTYFLPDAKQRLVELAAAGDIWTGERVHDEGQLEALIALYDGGIRYVDAKLGEWIEGWRRTGWLEETLLIVTADHGEALGQRKGGIRGHGKFFQEGLHVPLLVRHPLGVRAGERFGGVVSLVDIVPTVLQLAGIASRVPLPGQSLLDPFPPDRTVLASRPPREVVIQWPRKLLRKDEEFFGFDLQADPAELHPFHASEEEFDALRSKALGLRTSTAFYPPPIPTDALSDVEMRALEALGYAGELRDGADRWGGD